MNKGRQIKFRCLAYVMGATATMLTVAILSTFPFLTGGFGDQFIRWFMVYLVVLGLFCVIGGTRIHLRFKPVEKYYDQLEKGETPNEILTEKVRRFVLKYPLAGPINVAVQVTLGALMMAAAMALWLDRTGREIVFVLTICGASILIVVTMAYFLIKIAVRPIVHTLFENNPNIWEKDSPVKLSIKIKMLACAIAMLSAFGLLLLVTNTYFFNVLGEHGIDPNVIAVIKSTVLKATAIAVFAMLIVGSALALLAASDLGWPMAQISEAAESLSKGEVRDVIPWISEDETGALAASLNRMTQVMIGSLHDQVGKAEELLGSLSETVATLATSADSISEVTTRQLNTAASQATEAQEVSSALVEVSAAARRISAHAQAVQEMSKKAKKASESGGEDLHAAVAGITTVANRFQKVNESIVELGQSSEEIKLIVDVIEEVSAQINLLAFNASLEAAGAGQAGKRFAVVASEVGRLAVKTSHAISQIRTIIQDTLEAIDVTSRLAKESGEAAFASADVANSLETSFRRILDLVGSTTDLAKEIGDATKQQTTASELMVETMQGFADNASRIESDFKLLDKNVRELADRADVLSKLGAN